jgi:hypothetical protein
MAGGLIAGALARSSAWPAQAASSAWMVNGYCWGSEDVAEPDGLMPLEDQIWECRRVLSDK